MNLDAMFPAKNGHKIATRVRVKVHPPKRDVPIVVKPDGECKVKAFDGEDKVLTYRCAPCPVCARWLTVNPSHRYCEYCGQAVKFSV